MTDGRRCRSAAAPGRHAPGACWGSSTSGCTPGPPKRSGRCRRSPSMLVQLQARIDAEDRTEYIALHDDLTGLPNRRALLAGVRSPAGAHQKTAILFFDLDRFKVMNDFLGHASGDRVLTTIADRIRTSIRPQRLRVPAGGDEFVILVDEASSEMEVARLRVPDPRLHRRADRLRRPAGKPHGEHRHRPVQAGREERIGAPRVGRCGAVRRQAAGTEPGGGVRRGVAESGQLSDHRRS